MLPSYFGFQTRAAFSMGSTFSALWIPGLLDRRRGSPGPQGPQGIQGIPGTRRICHRPYRRMGECTHATAWSKDVAAKRRTAVRRRCIWRCATTTTPSKRARSNARTHWTCGGRDSRTHRGAATQLRPNSIVFADKF